MTELEGITKFMEVYKGLASEEVMKMIYMFDLEIQGEKSSLIDILCDIYKGYWEGYDTSELSEEVILTAYQTLLSE